MSTSARLILAASSLLLLLVYVLPIWRIDLEAPQYPEGLGMYIRVDDITGRSAHDLSNINNLNHYIGMKRIEPESIPELRIMPWLIGLLIGVGLLTAALGRRWLLFGWTAAFVVIAMVGLVDFYLWEYDYGHNLDQESAIIKIPGMNYQPPLIGSKQLLNFTAHSWPATGGWILFGAIGVGVVLSVREWRRARGRRREKASHLRLVAASLLAAVALSGCAYEPAPIRYGEVACVFCMMTVSDERYGAEMLTGTGKPLFFDSVECLAAHVQAHTGEPPHSLWVTDFSTPGTLVHVEDAFFLRSPNLRSPMGMNLTAFGPSMTRDAALNAFAGEVLQWEEVVTLVAERGFGTSAHGAKAAGGHTNDTP